MAARDGELAVFVHDFSTSVDAYREYTMLNEMWRREEARWKPW
jgi:hypothetical protein